MPHVQVTPTQEEQAQPDAAELDKKARKRLKREAKAAEAENQSFKAGNLDIDRVVKVVTSAISLISNHVSDSVSGAGGLSVQAQRAAAEPAVQRDLCALSRCGQPKTAGLA